MLRARSSARYFLIAAFCAAAATACGSAAAPIPSPSSAAPKVSLSIKVTGKPGAPATHWTLRCDPAGGTHPDPAAACATLLKAKNPFGPAQKGVDCPMIMVGSKAAIVKGTYFGKHVDRTFVDGGCDLPSWAKIGQIFN
ncbi:MAG TPA: SSI family serine proteinase inhibitor [Streptosporangiaceae bacterium]|nr:SSI family serine proteinase inhibitor [Streptosporangiaceae bacterium]